MNKVSESKSIVPVPLFPPKFKSSSVSTASNVVTLELKEPLADSKSVVLVEKEELGAVKEPLILEDIWADELNIPASKLSVTELPLAILDNPPPPAMVNVSVSKSIVPVPLSPAKFKSSSISWPSNVVTRLEKEELASCKSVTRVENDELGVKNEPLIEAAASEPNPLFHIPLVIVFESNIVFIVEKDNLWTWLPLANSATLPSDAVCPTSSGSAWYACSAGAPSVPATWLSFVKDSLLIAEPKLATPLPPLISIPAPDIFIKLSSEL